MKIVYKKWSKRQRLETLWRTVSLIKPSISERVKCDVLYDVRYRVGWPYMSFWDADEEYFYFVQDEIEMLINDTIEQTYTIAMSTDFHNKLMYDFLYKR